VPGGKGAWKKNRKNFLAVVKRWTKKNMERRKRAGFREFRSTLLRKKKRWYPIEGSSKGEAEKKRAGCRRKRVNSANSPGGGGEISRAVRAVTGDGKGTSENA